MEIANITVVFLYKPPSTKINVLLDVFTNVYNQYLQSCNTILIGDFNLNFKTKSVQQIALQKIASEHSYHQHIGHPTTDYQSTLDLIFSNMAAVQTGVLEMNFAHHKAVLIAI